MKNGIERRRYLRAPLALTLVVKTPQGPMEGKTVDISISGLSIMLFSEVPEIDEEFDVAIKLPTGRKMSIGCKKVWWGKRISNDNLYDAIGVHFTKISTADKKILTTLIEDHFLILTYKKFNLGKKVSPDNDNQ